MKRKYIITFFAAILLIAASSAKSPDTALATPDGWPYRPFTINVDGQVFELWGYDYWGGYGNFRLRDIAYILNGTSAQFNVRQPAGGHLHFWIERGAPYGAIGTELSYFYEDEREWREIGGFHFFALEHSPLQSVILSLDGGDTPDASIALPVLRNLGFPTSNLGLMADIDSIYFHLESFAHVLGFSIEWDSPEWPRGALNITTNEALIAENFETQPLELLDLSLRLTGHWVDRMFYDSDIINERVAWPHEFEIGLHGLTDSPSFVDFHFSGRPLMARQPNVWREHEGFSPFQMQTLDNGLTELVLTENRRIVVEPAAQIDEFVYYVDGVAHEMVRLDARRSPARYTYEAHDGGGIRLAYMPDFQSFWALPEYIFIYRSEIQGKDGVRIATHRVEGDDDRILFEFIDETAEYGRVYYYSLRLRSPRDNTIIPLFTINSQTQMVVNTSNVLVPPVYEPEDAAEEPEEVAEQTVEAPRSMRWIVFALPTAIAAIGAIGYAFYRKKVSK